MRALVVGRFQPFHMGHLRMVEYVMSREDKVVIGIGSANKSRTKDNPFNAEERADMICNSLSTGNFEIAKIPDFGDDKKWVEWIMSSIDFDVVYTNSENEAGIFSKAGLEVLKIPFFEREKYSAVEVRKRMLKNGDWEDLVPPGTLAVLTGIKWSSIIKNLYPAGKTKPKKR